MTVSQSADRTEPATGHATSGERLSEARGGARSVTSTSPPSHPQPGRSEQEKQEEQEEQEEQRKQSEQWEQTEQTEQDIELSPLVQPSRSAQRGHGTGAVAGADSARRRRRVGTVAGVSVAMAAVSAALVGGWMMVQDSLNHDGPDGYRGGPTMMVPTGGPDRPSVFPSESGTPTGAGSASPSELLSAPPASTPAPTGSDSGKPGGATRPSSSTTSGSGSGSGSGDHSSPPDDDTPPVLSMGDTGPEVVDLQNRLKTVGGLYGDPSDGVYDEGVKDAVATFQEWRAVRGDSEGVYGEHTRKALETETGGPSDDRSAQATS